MRLVGRRGPLLRVLELRLALVDANLIQRVWCETAKVINLKDGRLSCVYA